MPLKRCKEGKEQGWKWGDQGKCYTGKDAKKKAIKQGIAVEGPEGFKKAQGTRSEEILSIMREYLFGGKDAEECCPE